MPTGPPSFTPLILLFFISSAADGGEYETAMSVEVHIHTHIHKGGGGLQGLI